MTATDPGRRRTSVAPVAAVVVNYNAKDLLLKCLESVLLEGVDDIVVADNESVDGSEAAVRAAFPDVIYHRTGGNLGYGTGANRGAALTDRAIRYLLVLNPDTVIAPGTVDALVGVLESDERIGAVGPRIVESDGRLYPSVRTFPTLVDSIGHAFLGIVWPGNPFTRRYRMLDWDHSQPADVDWVSGSCFLVRRTAWDQIGGFDERYFMYAEDVDLCWRLHRAGWRVAYEPRGEVTHVQGASTDRHPYWMIAEHHRALYRFASSTTAGARRLLLPLMAAGLAVRTPLAWAHRYVVGRRVK